MNICKSSLDALKTELLKKQEEIQKRKQQDNCLKPVIQEKKNVVLKNSGVEDRNLKDIAAIEEVDADVLLKSRRVLEAKSKLYEKLKNTDNEEVKSKYLIDFNLKNEIYSKDEPPPSRDEPKKEDKKDSADEEEYNSDENSDPENDWVDFVDTLGRSRRCLRRDLPQMKAKDEKLANALHPPSPPPDAEPTPEMLSWDMQREALRKKWEEQESLLLGKTDIHYQDLLFDEARPHGVGYFEFSKDEDERLRQQEDLRKLRKETMEKQAEARRRKREELGLPPEEEEDPAEAGETETNEAVEPKDLNVEDLEAKIKKMAPVRPWDIGKVALPLMTQEEWVEKKRQERPEEFAPPRSVLKNAVTINTDDKTADTQNITDGITDNWNILIPQTTGKLNFFTTKRSLPTAKPAKHDLVRYSDTDVPDTSMRAREDSSLENNNLKSENIVSKGGDYCVTKKLTNVRECRDSMLQDVNDDETDDDWIGPLPGEAWKQNLETPTCSTANMFQSLSEPIVSNESLSQQNSPIYSGSELPSKSNIKINLNVSQNNAISKFDASISSSKPELSNLKDITVNGKENPFSLQNEDDDEEDWVGPMPVGWKKETQDPISAATNNKLSTLTANNSSEVLNRPSHPVTESPITSVIENFVTSTQVMMRADHNNIPLKSKQSSQSNTSHYTQDTQAEINNISEDNWIGPKPECRNVTTGTASVSNKDLSKLSQPINKNYQTNHVKARGIFSSEQNQVRNLPTFQIPCNNLRKPDQFGQMNNYSTTTTPNTTIQYDAAGKKTSSPDSSNKRNKYTPQSIDALLLTIREKVEKTENINNTDLLPITMDQISSKTQNAVVHDLDDAITREESSDDSRNYPIDQITGDSVVPKPRSTNFSNKHIKLPKNHQRNSQGIKRKDPPNLNLNVIPDSILKDDDFCASTSGNSRVNPSKRKWAEIPPPSSMDYYANDKRNFKQSSTRVDLKESISVGMDFLNSQKHERSKKKIKGLLDII